MTAVATDTFKLEHASTRPVKPGPRRTAVIIWHLSKQQYRVRYRRVFLGAAWAPVLPVLRFLVFYTFFAKIVVVKQPNFAIYLFIGVVIWTWFSSALLAATSSVIHYPDLLFRGNIPRITAPLVATIVEFFDLLMAMPFVILAVSLTGDGLHASVVVLPLLLALMFLLVLAIALPLCTANVYLRDIHLFLTAIMMFWMFLTPVFYSLSIVPSKYQRLIQWNPVTKILTSVRSVLLDGKVPAVQDYWLFTALVVAACATSIALYTVVSRKFVDEL